MTQYPITWGENKLGIVIGSTKLFWEGFVKYLRSLDAATSIPKDPIDQYCSKIIVESLKEVNPTAKYEIRYDSHAPRSGKYVHIQTAAHLAGSSIFLIF